MNKDNDNNIVLESGFAFKAEKVKYHQKGKKKVNFYSNRKKDITESENKINLPDTIKENKVYEQVEKHSQTMLRIVD